MEQKTATELCAELKVDPSFVEATIGLDTGRLLKSTTHAYFIAPRMGSWEVVEQILLSDLSRVEKQSSFMGDTFVFHTKSGRWICKNVTENVDLRQWVLQKARGISSGRHQSPTTSSSNATKTQPDTHSEWGESSSSVSLHQEATEDFFARERSSTSSQSRSYTDSESSDRSKTQKDLPEELESVFNQMTENPIESTSPPVSRNQDVDALLEKMSSTEEEDASGCGGSTLVKFIFFIWIVSSFLDVCN